MIAILIKLNGYIKNEAVMTMLPVVVASVLYYVAWLISKYAEPALRNALKWKRQPAPQAGSGL